MKTERPYTRDIREDQSEREEKLGQPMDSMPGKTGRDRTPALHESKPRREEKAKAVARGPLPSDVTLPGKAERKRNIAFRLSAPGAARVFLAGTFNHWNPAAAPMSPGKGGEWMVEQSLAPGEYEYRFVVDGEWREDPQARQTAPNPFGGHNSVVLVPALSQTSGKAGGLR